MPLTFHYFGMKSRERLRLGIMTIYFWPEVHCEPASQKGNQEGW